MTELGFEPGVSDSRILAFSIHTASWHRCDLDLGYEGWAGLAHQVQGLSQKSEYFGEVAGGGMHMKEKVGVERLDGIGFWRTFNTITKN